MTRRRRRIILGAILAWLVVSPVVWALYQWQSERSARSASGLATSLTPSSTCSAWAAGSAQDRQGFARREALRRGWTATHGAVQVEVRIVDWCRGTPDQALGGFATVAMALTSENPIPGQ